jgi:hypothetical protein
VTYTVTNCDTSLTYTFKEVNCTTGAVIGTLSGNNGGCSLTHTFPQDGADHCVVVTVSNANGSCPVTSSPVTRRINAPVTVTLVQTAAGCNGAVTLTAAGQGGDGSYTYTFSGATGTVSGNTIVLQPQLNGVCRTVSVTATSAGCTSAPASYAFSQCVTTTACP